MAADGVAFTADQAYPEGIAYSAKDKTFIVSSLRHGVIARVSASGDYQPFITDEKLISTVGVLWDRKRNLLWVANSDPGLWNAIFGRDAQQARGRRRLRRQHGRATGLP